MKDISGSATPTEALPSVPILKALHIPQACLPLSGSIAAFFPTGHIQSLLPSSTVEWGAHACVCFIREILSREKEPFCFAILGGMSEKRKGNKI